LEEEKNTRVFRNSWINIQSNRLNVIIFGCFYSGVIFAALNFGIYLENIVSKLKIMLFFISKMR